MSIRGSRGYVLLIVLMLLALAAVALAGACRLTLRRSTAATVALADLQQRWGSITTQYTLLTDAANTLDRAEGNGPPRPTLHGSFPLGHLQFDVDLCDEQARANVNGLLAWRGRDAAEAAVRDLARVGGSRLAPRLPPPPPKAVHALSSSTADDPSPDDVARPPPLLGSLTEVFPSADWDDLRPSPTSVSNQLTCFGDGKLNLRRASPAALSAVLSLRDAPSPTPDQIARLAQIGRSPVPALNIADTLTRIGIMDAVASKIVGRLVDGSDTQSVWIDAHDDRRRWRSWAVRDGTDADHPRTFTGAW